MTTPLQHSLFGTTSSYLEDKTKANSTVAKLSIVNIHQSLQTDSWFNFDLLYL